MRREQRKETAPPSGPLPVLVPLGRSDLYVPPLSLGTWAWGDTTYWGYGHRFGPSDVVDAFTASLEGAVAFFDTAEAYGLGASERILGALARRTETSLVLATKFAPYRGRGGVRAIPAALAGSLRRLGTRSIDLYQVHWADRDETPIGELMMAFAKAVRLGLVRAVGVCNYSAAELREAHAALAAEGVPLASVQVRYNILHRTPERDGVLEACRTLGVTLLAYSPLAQGVLTDAYDATRLPAGPRASMPDFAPARLRAAELVLTELRSIGQAHGGRGPEQVALNWLRAKPSVIPVVGVTNGRQARACVACLDWSLQPEELSRLDAAAEAFERAVATEQRTT